MKARAQSLLDKTPISSPPRRHTISSHCSLVDCAEILLTNHRLKLAVYFDISWLLKRSYHSWYDDNRVWLKPIGKTDLIAVWIQYENNKFLAFLAFSFALMNLLKIFFYSSAYLNIDTKNRIFYALNISW